MPKFDRILVISLNAATPPVSWLVGRHSFPFWKEEANPGSYSAGPGARIQARVRPRAGTSHFARYIVAGSKLLVFTPRPASMRSRGEDPGDIACFMNSWGSDPLT